MRKGDCITLNTINSFVHAYHKLAATMGVDNLVVAETKDAVLVAHKEAVQSVKGVVNIIKNDGRHEHMNHREVYRPWGKYGAIDIGGATG